MKSHLIRAEDLSAGDREAMYRLLNQHFKGVKPEVFATDLAQKNWVLLLKDDADTRLQGFSTLQIQQLEFQEELIGVVYSGDTIMDPSGWTSSALPRAWIAAVNYLRQQIETQKLYWLLICSGYRTYRFLPVFWKEFYPVCDRVTPAKKSALMAFLAHSYYQQNYDEQSGLVNLAHPQILREPLSSIPTNRQTDPHIRFFEAKNPGHLNGDELVCLTEICPENLTRAGQRMWFAGTNGLKL